MKCSVDYLAELRTFQRTRNCVASVAVTRTQVLKHWLKFKRRGKTLSWQTGWLNDTANNMICQRHAVIS